MNTYQDPLLYTMNTGFPRDIYNRKDREGVRMPRAVERNPLPDAEKRTLMIRTLNQEYGTRNLQYLGVGEQRDVLFPGT